MCEIFGVCAKNCYAINDYLKEFFSHSVKHPHGWGLACMGDENEVMIEKEPLQASKSLYLKERLRAPIKVSHALAHIRYATIGNLEYLNCHPYIQKDNGGRRWTLVHNGTIFDYEPLEEYADYQKGSTDSERILLYLVDKINMAEMRLGRSMYARERFRLIDAILVDMSVGNKLNMLIYDGELMYVHTNYANTLHFLQKRDGVIFSTQPLGRGDWKDVPFCTLLAYREGQLMFRGTSHGHEYFDNAENEKYLYQIYAGL